MDKTGEEKSFLYIMEKLNRNFQREISNLSYWTECFCVDPNPPIFLSSFITAEVDIERHYSSTKLI
jgi:hypothetical protein